MLAAVEGGITCFAAHPSGAFLAIGTSSGTVLLYDLRGPDLKYASLLQLQLPGMFPSRLTAGTSCQA